VTVTSYVVATSAETGKKVLVPHAPRRTAEDGQLLQLTPEQLVSPMPERFAESLPPKVRSYSAARYYVDSKVEDLCRRRSGGAALRRGLHRQDPSKLSKTLQSWQS
jgi:hypothetical protein